NVGGFSKDVAHALPHHTPPHPAGEKERCRLMSDRLNISYCASSIAAALLRAGKAGVLTKGGIDAIRAAAAGYFAAGPHNLTKYDTEKLIEATLRKTVERVG